MARKLGRPTKERIALLRNQVSELLWYGSLKTTLHKAKEVRPLAEKMITLAMNTYEDVLVETVEKTNLKGEKVSVEVKKDGPKKLAARRKMMSYLRDIQEAKLEKESKSAYNNRTKAINHPLIEKMYSEYAPKFAQRRDEGKKGGYTRISKLGQRRGDAAEMAQIDII